MDDIRGAGFDTGSMNFALCNSSRVSSILLHLIYKTIYEGKYDFVSSSLDAVEPTFTTTAK